VCLCVTVPAWLGMVVGPSSVVSFFLLSFGRPNLLQLVPPCPPCCTPQCAVMTRFYKGIRVDPFENMPFTVLVTINGSEPAKWPGWNTFVSAFRFCAGITGCRNLWLLKPTR
jgi:hypothetical protein